MRSRRKPTAAETCQRPAAAGAACHCGEPATAEIDGYDLREPPPAVPKWVPVCDAHNPFREWNRARARAGMRRAITLIELLIVVAILAILIGLL